MRNLLKLSVLLTVFVLFIISVGFVKYASAAPVTATEIENAATVEYGDKGASVTVWQKFLNEYGSAGLTADGNFGAITETEAKAWQRTHQELSPDGVLGRASRTAAATQIRAGGGGESSGGNGTVKIDVKKLNLLARVGNGTGNGEVLTVNQAGLTTNESIFGATRSDDYAGPRLFNLSDPMNPSLTKSWNTNPTDDAAGDYGPTWRIADVAWSPDGMYSAAHGAGSQSQIYFYHNVTGAPYRFVPEAGHSLFGGIMQSGGNTLLVLNDRIVDMTDIDKQPKNPRLLSNGTSPKDFPRLPSGVPQFTPYGPRDRSIILGDTLFAHYFSGESALKGGTTSTPRLAIYAINQTSQLDQINLPMGLVGDAGQVNGFVSPRGEKYIILGGGKYIYKVESNKLLVIAEGLDLGSVTAAVGVVVGGSPAVMTFTSETAKPHIYLISDLKNNSIKDLSSSVNIQTGRVAVATAFHPTSGNSYVYTSGDNGIYVWNLNGTGSGGGGSENTAGTLTFTPNTIKDGDGFEIKLRGGEANITPEHWIATSGVANSAFRSFGNWANAKTNTSGDFTLSRTLDCSAYASYTPGINVNVKGDATITNKYLVQLEYLKYPNGKQSNTALHIVNCGDANPLENPPLNTTNKPCAVSIGGTIVYSTTCVQ